MHGGSPEALGGPPLFQGGITRLARRHTHHRAVDSGSEGDEYD